MTDAQRYVQRNLQSTMHPINDDIVELPQGYDTYVTDPEHPGIRLRPDLTPEQREDAEIEVAILGWSYDWFWYEGDLRVVEALHMMLGRIRALEASNAALEARVSALEAAGQ